MTPIETQIAAETATSPTTTAKRGPQIRAAYFAVAQAAAEYSLALSDYAITITDAGKALADYADAANTASDACDKYMSALDVFEREK